MKPALRPHASSDAHLPSVATLDDNAVRVMCAESLGLIPEDDKGVIELHGLESLWYSGSIPNFPADLNAAMQLCDALGNEGWKFACVRHRSSGTWSAGFEWDEETHHWVTDIPTLALAICRCYLITKGLAQ